LPFRKLWEEGLEIKLFLDILISFIFRKSETIRNNLGYIPKYLNVTERLALHLKDLTCFFENFRRRYFLFCAIKMTIAIWHILQRVFFVLFVEFFSQICSVSVVWFLSDPIWRFFFPQRVFFVFRWVSHICKVKVVTSQSWSTLKQKKSKSKTHSMPKKQNKSEAEKST